MSPGKFEMHPEDVISKLGDQEVLRNYCVFAGLHRALVGVTLFRALGPDERQRRSIGLEIFGNFVAALEDAALWFFVLKEWADEEPLFDLLDRIEIREAPGHRHSSERALEEISGWTIADLRREFRLPTDDSLLRMGWTEQRLNYYINVLRSALESLKSALEARTDDDRILVSSYNKIKHGALAVATNDHSRIGVSVMIPSRKGPIDPGSGKRKINAGWIPCEDDELARVVKNTMTISTALAAILNLIYASRFDRNWEVPSPPPIVNEWLEGEGQLG